MNPPQKVYGPKRGISPSPSHSPSPQSPPAGPRSLCGSSLRLLRPVLHRSNRGEFWRVVLRFEVLFGSPRYLPPPPIPLRLPSPCSLKPSFRYHTGYDRRTVPLVSNTGQPTSFGGFGYCLRAITLQATTSPPLPNLYCPSRARPPRRILESGDFIV